MLSRRGGVGFRDVEAPRSGCSVLVPDRSSIAAASIAAVSSLPAAASRPGASDAGGSGAGNLGVLLADPVLRAVTVRRLELLGYQVTLLPEDPAAAPVVAADEGVHGVLIDLDLPDGAGLRIVERLASEDATAALPVLGLATDTPQGLVEEAFAAGVADFLILPYDPLVLEAKAAGLLTTSAAS